jgi:hypothetical protein
MYCRSNAWVGVTRVLYFKDAEDKLQKCHDTRAEEKFHKSLKIKDTLKRREAVEEITKQDRSRHRKVTTQKRRNFCNVLIVLYPSQVATDALNTV